MVATSPRATLLITGASGFLGRALCQEMEGGVFVLRVLQHRAQEPAGAVQTVTGDLLNPDSLHAACRGCEVVVHLAGTAHVTTGQDSTAEQLIVEGSRNLLKAAIASNVRRLVYVSSSLARAAGEGDGDVTAYGWYKAAAENLLLEANTSGAIEVVIIRPVNVYGPGMQGNIARMIQLVHKGRLPPLPAFSTRLSLVSAIDVAQALRLAIASPLATGRTFTVTDGQEYRICDIEAAIYAALGKRFPRWRVPRMVLFAAAFVAGVFAVGRGKGSPIGLRTYRNLTTENVFDNGDLCRELGFNPRTTFYQELPQIVMEIVGKISQNGD